MNSGEATAIIVIFIVVFAIAMIPYIFFILTLQNTLLKVSNENRKMSPSETWLLLIPFFNIVWQFIVVNRIADSLAAEFEMRGINVNQTRPGYEIGLAYCICSICSIIPFLGILSGLAGFILWIVYWVQINDFKVKLSSPYDPTQGKMPSEKDWFNDTQKLEH